MDTDWNLKKVQEYQSRLLKEVIRICDENDLHYYAAYGTALGAVRHHGFIPWDGDVDIYIPENQLDRFVQVMEEKLDKDQYWLDFRSDPKTMRDFPRVGIVGHDTGVLHVDVFRLAGAPSEVKEQKRLRFWTGLIHRINDVKQKGVRSYILKRYKVLGALLVAAVTAPVPLRKTVTWIDYFSRKYPFDKAEYVGNSASAVIGSIFPKSYLGEGILVPFEEYQIRVPSNYDAYLTKMYGDYHKVPSLEERENVLNRVYRMTINPSSGLMSLYHYEKEK